MNTRRYFGLWSARGRARAKAEAEAAESALLDEPWQEHRVLRAGFSISMPGIVEEEIDPRQVSGGGLEYVLRRHRGGFTYMASCCDFTRAPNGEAAARRAIESQRVNLAESDFRLMKEEIIRLAGAEGTQFLIAYKTGTQCTRRSACIGARLYRLDVTYDAVLSDQALDKCSDFFSSFRLSGAPPSDAARTALFHAELTRF